MQVAPRAQRDVAEVGLGHHEHVGDLHDPRLQELQDVARAGLDDDGDGVGHLGDVGLALADADGLDHDDVEGGGQRLRGRARGGREPAEAPGRGGRADEDAAVGRVEGDPRAVAEQRAARAPRRRVDGEHRDAAPAGPPRAHELAQQRRLARAGRPGDADDVRARLAAQRGGGDLAQQRGDLLARAPARLSTRLSTAGAARRSPSRRRAPSSAPLGGSALRRAPRRRRGAPPPAPRCRA